MCMNVYAQNTLCKQMMSKFNLNLIKLSHNLSVIDK